MPNDGQAANGRTQMAKEFLFTITKHHISHPEELARVHFGSSYPTSVLDELTNCIGTLQACDVGKDVYRVNGALQVENREQMLARLAT